MGRAGYISTLILTAVLLSWSCSGFLDRTPQDGLPTGDFWETEEDARLALVGCYSWFESGMYIFLRDCASDNGYCHPLHAGWQLNGNGRMTPGDPGHVDFNYTTISRTNEFLENIEDIKFLDSETKRNYTGEVRFLRAYRYFIMWQSYGDVPLATRTYSKPEEAKVPRDPKEKVEEFLISELLEAIADMRESHPDRDYGRATKNAGRALLMRVYLYKGMYREALETAREIEGHDLFPSFEGLFLLENENNEEVIFDMQYEDDYYSMFLVRFIPNGNGGWSSAVPLQSLVDAYEMSDGRTIEEARSDGDYDETNPYYGRDPRLRATVIYPGQLWEGSIYSSIVPRDINHPTRENNSTKTGYNLKKYVNELSQYKDIRETGTNIMIFRYAEVLLTIAEAKIELGELDEEMYSAMDRVRERAGMPPVDRVKYASQEKLRELVRRERRVELAFEGLRRYDIIRWGIAKDVMNGEVYGCREGEIVDLTYPNGDRKVNLNGEPFLVETRIFEDKHVYFPIPQSSIDTNPALLPNNPGY